MGRLGDLRKMVNEMLDQTLKYVYSDFDQAVDQVEALLPGVLIFRS